MKKFEKRINNYKIQFVSLEETENSITFRITLPPKRRKHRSASIVYNDLVELIKDECSQSLGDTLNKRVTTVTLQPLKNSFIDISLAKNKSVNIEPEPQVELRQEASAENKTKKTSSRRSSKSKTKKRSSKSKTMKKEVVEVETEVEKEIETEVEVIE